MEQFPHVTLDKTTFITYVKRFNESNRKKRISHKNKKSIMNTFDLETWNKLSDDNKLLHTIKHCEPCLHLSSSDANPVPCFTSTPTPTTPSSSSMSTPVTPRSSLCVDVDIPDKYIPGADSEVAKEFLSKANENFSNIFGKSFTSLVVKIPESNLTEKLSESLKKKKLRKMQRNIKEKIEKELHARDTSTHYGTRQTKAQYTKQRLAVYFESKEAACSRTEKRKYYISILYKYNFFNFLFIH